MSSKNKSRKSKSGSNKPTVSAEVAPPSSRQRQSKSNGDSSSKKKKRKKKVKKSVSHSHSSGNSNTNHSNRKKRKLSTFQHQETAAFVGDVEVDGFVVEVLPPTDTGVEEVKSQSRSRVVKRSKPNAKLSEGQTERSQTRRTLESLDDRFKSIQQMFADMAERSLALETATRSTSVRQLAQDRAVSAYVTDTRTNAAAMATEIEALRGDVQEVVTTTTELFKNVEGMRKQMGFLQTKVINALSDMHGSIVARSLTR